MQGIRRVCYFENRSTPFRTSPHLLYGNGLNAQAGAADSRSSFGSGIDNHDLVLGYFAPAG